LYLSSFSDLDHRLRHLFLTQSLIIFLRSLSQSTGLTDLFKSSNHQNIIIMKIACVAVVAALFLAAPAAMAQDTIRAGAMTTSSVTEDLPENADTHAFRGEEQRSRELGKGKGGKGKGGKGGKGKGGKGKGE
jgi:hypothetical protein